MKGNKKEDFEVKSLLGDFEKVNIDLGTGDGRLVYKKAAENPRELYIGIDPSARQLETFSKKANRKRLNNVLFVVGSAENLPLELMGVANKLSIVLPWGTLLQTVVLAKRNELKNILGLLKAEGELEVVLGYSQKSEPSETDRLGLPEITEDYVKTSIIPEFKKLSLGLVSNDELEKIELKNLDTTWGNKLSFGADRKVFRLIFIKN